MKKSVLFIVLIFFTSLSCLGQGIVFGVKVNFNLTEIDAFEVEDFPGLETDIDPVLSSGLNGFVTFRKDKLIGFSLEPGYIKKGARFNNPSIIGGDVTVNMHYLHFPILLNFNLNNRLTISIGPEYAYLIKSTIGEDTPIFEGFYDEKVELSGTIGVSYQLNELLGFGLRVNRGFTSINELIVTDINGNPIDEGKEYNQYGQLFVSFSF